MHTNAPLYAIMHIKMDSVKCTLEMKNGVYENCQCAYLWAAEVDSFEAVAPVVMVQLGVYCTVDQQGVKLSAVL